MKKRVLFTFVAMTLVFTMLFSTTAFAAARITVGVSRTAVTTQNDPSEIITGGNPALWARFLAYIAEARNYLDITPDTAEHEMQREGEWNPAPWTAPGGPPPHNIAHVRVGYWGAPDEDKANLLTAIEHAEQIAYDNLQNLTRGQEFFLTIGLEDLPPAPAGIAGMYMMFAFPPGIEVLGVDDSLMTTGVPPAWLEFFRNPYHDGTFERARTLTIPAAAGIEGTAGVTYNVYHAGWAGTTDNLSFAGSRYLFTWRVRVANDAPLGQLPPIVLQLANAEPPYTEQPTDAAFRRVRFNFPDHTPENPSPAWEGPYEGPGASNNWGSIGTFTVVPS